MSHTVSQSMPFSPVPTLTSYAAGPMASKRTTAKNCRKLLKSILTKPSRRGALGRKVGHPPNHVAKPSLPVTGKRQGRLPQEKQTEAEGTVDSADSTLIGGGDEPDSKVHTSHRASPVNAGVRPEIPREDDDLESLRTRRTTLHSQTREEKETKPATCSPAKSLKMATSSILDEPQDTAIEPMSRQPRLSGVNASKAWAGLIRHPRKKLTPNKWKRKPPKGRKFQSTPPLPREAAAIVGPAAAAPASIKAASEGGEKEKEGVAGGEEEDEGEGEEPIRDIELENADALLPSYKFPHFDWVWGQLWTEEDEFELKKTKDYLLTAMVCWRGKNRPEALLWRTLVHLYGCLPCDLFRYGLKLDSSICEEIETERGRVRTRSIEGAGSAQLQELICHPVWEGNIAFVRYALQLAVFCRVEHHTFPLGPGARVGTNDQDEIFRSLTVNAGPQPEEERLAVLGEYHYQLYLQSGPGTDKDIQHLLTELQREIKPEPAQSPQEKELFLLRAGDIQAVKMALDNLRIYGQKKWRPTEDYCTAYAAATQNQGSERYRYPAALARLKTACFLAGEREKMIRARLRRLGCEDALLDIPERDPTPFYMQSARLSKEQQDVLRGVVYPADEVQLPERLDG